MSHKLIEVQELLSRRESSTFEATYEAWFTFRLTSRRPPRSYKHAVVAMSAMASAARKDDGKVLKLLLLRNGLHSVAIFECLAPGSLL